MSQRREIGHCPRRGRYLTWRNKHTADEEQPSAQKIAGHLHVSGVASGDRAEDQSQIEKGKRSKDDTGDQEARASYLGTKSENTDQSRYDRQGL